MEMFLLYIHVLASFLALTTADYECLCNYHVEAVVHQTRSDQSPHIGSLSEFDCKPTYALTSSKTQWQAVQYEKQVGYVALDAQTKVQTCPGNPRQIDIVEPTTTIKTTVTTDAVTTKPTTISTTTTTATTPTTSSTTAKPTTFSTTTTIVTTPPSSGTTTDKPTTFSTTTSAETTPTTASTTAGKPTTFSTTTTTLSSSNTPSSTILASTTTTSVLPSTVTSQAKTTHASTPTARKLTSSSVTTTTKPITSTATTTKSTTTSLKTTHSTARALQCPPQVPRTRNLKDFGGRCYEFILDVHKNWPDSEKDCNRKGGHLVSIRSKAEQDFVYWSLGELHFHGDDGVWIGLTDQHHESRWTWSSGEKNTFTYWAKSQPGIGGSFEDCALMDMGEKGHWGDYSCKGILFTHQRHGYVCEYNKI